MQITHFTQTENQEWKNTNLNKLKPVNQVIWKVIFDVEEKLDDKLEKFFDFNFKDYLDEGNKDDNIEAIEKYRFLSKYFDIYSLMDEKWFNLVYFDENLKKYFRIWYNIDQEVYNFLHEKYSFKWVEDFLKLCNWLDTPFFIKNFKYLEEFLWRKKYFRKSLK